ncbi:carbonic anhydrase [Thermoactinomyces sp. DSM 45892]|uniref:beta-class carbonic anhydrase n=1 Tax=Thermoactinomyces sp. DSM 45892 TaxID=1882753 RepID=UPI000B86F36A|nr:carbonic anhydrase [Thermoactinomyces sp. DSM 45892]
MSKLEGILAYNDKFVRRKEYMPYQTGKYPGDKILVVTCMDTRLLELLPKAMNIQNGDAKVVKTAGALITSPYGSVMRSILVGVSLLAVEEVFVIGHHDCGMIGLESGMVLERIQQMGVNQEALDSVYDQGVEVEKWLCGCGEVEEGVMQSVRMIRNHPLFPSNIPVHGLVIDPNTGKLDEVVRGYE